MNIKTKKIVIGLITLLIIGYNTKAQPVNSEVKIVGAMKDVMWSGQLYGKIKLDTIANKQHLYGLGPAEYLTGELIIIDGKSYKSTVATDKGMKVEAANYARAPFFSYANIESWNEYALADSIQTIEHLEHQIDQCTKSFIRPFLFRLTAVVENAQIHIVNLPAGSTVSSPDEAHLGRRSYTLTNEAIEIIGFFSREHQAIFTHHNTFLHMHLITTDRQKMGHLDALLFRKGTLKLFLPEN